MNAQDREFITGTVQQDTKRSDALQGWVKHRLEPSETEKSYYVVATSGGCPSNLLEAAAWRQNLSSRGYVQADTPESADVIIVNTCAVRLDQEDKAVRIIQDFQRRFGKEKRVLVSGCLEGINPDRLREAFSGETVHPPEGYLEFQSSQHHFDASDFERLDFKHHVVLFLRSWYFSMERLAGRRFQPLHNLLRTVMVSEQFYLLTVATGCLGHCTYCGIKNFKGPVRSRPLESILEEFDAALAGEHRDFWLIADDLGCWGQDFGGSLPELLSAILSRRADFTLVINYLDPAFLTKYENELATLFGDPRIILVNIPIQSGSPEVLKRMGRSGNLDKVMAWMEKVKRNHPALVLKTNVMVGFPGESWKDLAQTWKALARFDAIVALPFSARPDTPASMFPDQHGTVSTGVRLASTQAVVLATHLYRLVRSFRRTA
jgi:MiaB/RimO family radical SAM methylthiotransferase